VSGALLQFGPSSVVILATRSRAYNDGEGNSRMSPRILLGTALVILSCFASVVTAQPSCSQPAPTLIAPADGATEVSPPVTFQWSAVSGALGYNVWAALDGGEFVQIGETTATDFTAEIPSNTFVEWYVESHFASCDSPSEHAEFLTRTCFSAATTLIEPQDGSLAGSPVTFSWTEVPEAAAYRVWLVVPNDAGDFDYFPIDETSLVATTARVSPGAYGWFVETVFDECDSGYSEVFVFEILRSDDCSEASATLLSPLNGATDVTAPVTFQWVPVPDAIGYEVWAAYEDGDFEFIADTTDSSVEAWVGDGTFTWVVITQFNGCDDTISEPFTFTIPYRAECDGGVPYPISPSDGDIDVPTTMDFIWTPVDGAKLYNVWVVAGENEPVIIGSTTATRLRATVPEGDIFWAIEVELENCPADSSAVSYFQASSSAGCAEPIAPEIFLEPEAISGDSYLLIWSPGLNTSSYEVQESISPAFEDPTTITLTDILLFPSKTVSEPTRFYYRVRSDSSCGLGFGPYSEVASILIAPDEPLSTADADMVTSYGTQKVVVQEIHVPGVSPEQAFTASTDQSWMRVEPSSFLLTPDGIDLTITADPRDLSTGSNTATLILTPAAGAVTTHGTTTSIPVNINLVTPVSPDAGKAPLPTSLIIPAVGHAIGAGATFESDVRLTNTSAKMVKYLLNFTPTGSDGTKVGQQATIQVEPGETTALNDVLKNFFGFAGATDNVQGVLEIRPLESTSGSNSSIAGAAAATFASSRTFANTPTGTFGQYIPAIPFSSFIGKDKVLSLQQIAQSAKYRTNLGLVEASGEPAAILVSVFGDTGAKLGDYPINLRPGEHMQLGRFLESKGLSVNDGRIEVKVTSSTGKVTAYASVLDNATNDPLLVLPVDASAVTASRYVIPGVAAINTGAANWRSDVRLFNAGTAAVNATLQFFSQGGGAPIEKTITVDAGKVTALDDVLPSVFNVLSGGGSLLVSTQGNSKLVATARTYNLTSNGTYGQFVPGITPQEGVGRNDRALQILQVEQSERFRTNVGIVELTGNPVTVEISAFKPDSKVAVSTQVSLGANQFIQYGNLLSLMGLPTTYNARVALKVIDGNGRIGGYASLIDNRTQDPTYVPAQ